MQARKKDEFVIALARGLAVIKAFDKDASALSLTDVAKCTGLARATSRRLLFTLETLGYVRSDGKHFSLTPRVLELGYAYLASKPLADLALPIIKQVVEELGESCSLAVLDGEDIVYIARVPPKHLMTIPVNVGSRLPAFITSTGRVLLAALPSDELSNILAAISVRKFTRFTVTKQKLPAVLRLVAAQGYALADQELEEGLRALAVPVRSRTGAVVAALNVSAHAMRASKADMIRKYLPVLLRAAEQISGLA
jgi:IclR family pca regulon transcriptional regulator